MTKYLREPFVHFVILGAALFAGHALWQSKAGDEMTIVVSPAEMERQAMIFAGEQRKAPSEEDLQALMFAYVEEEALMREALKLGLDQDDTIIRRRLAQKMRFMIEDVAPPTVPKDKELKAWFEKNKNEFARPECVNFRHIYVSPDTHGDDTQAEADKILNLVNKDYDGDWKSLGDPFMMRRDYSDVTFVDVTRLFGQDFAKSLGQQETGSWQGPIGSAFGLHIVSIDKRTEQNLPAFEDIRDEIVAEWQEQSRRSSNQDRLKMLIKKYKVEIGEASQ
ncbi:MAG: peptidyl-prolyl cis-trans isomerase [Maricaulaceae bacterium]